MEDKFPTLTLMGITNPTQIQSYSLAQVGPSKDVLKIRYKRPAGSLRASSRTMLLDLADGSVSLKVQGVEKVL